MMTLAVFAIVLSTTGAPQLAPAQAPGDVMHISGKKNPELIPEWSVWEDALRLIAGGSRQLPTAVLIHTTKEEEALILHESVQQSKRDSECRARVLALKPGSDAPDVLTGKMQAIKLECRWEALRARDRILAAVSPAVRAALMAFVESIRAATTVDILKRDLAFFLQPQ